MAENRVTSKLFTETLRPKTLDDLITFDRVKNGLRNGIQGNYLFCGTQGIGKTSVCRILCKDYETLTINCSLDRGIDTIRESIVSFCSSSSLFGEDGVRLKAILLEEMDNLTKDSFLSLRSLIEKYAKNVRFLANCNYVQNVPDPILSRFEIFLMDPQTEEEKQWLFNAYVARTKQILTALKIGFTDETVAKFIKRFYPDYRSVVKTMQSMYTRGCTEIPQDVASDGSDLTSLFTAIFSQPDPVTNYKNLYLEWNMKADLGIIEIGKQFPEHLIANYPNLGMKLPTAIIAIAEHQAILPQAADHFVVLLSLVYKLQIILKQ